MNYDTSIHMNPDANAWAKFFMQTRAENPDLVIDEALMVGWFANAMMAMHDHLQGGGPINGDHAEHILASGAAPKVEPCKPLCELCVKRGYNFCANAAETTPLPQAAREENT